MKIGKLLTVEDLKNMEGKTVWSEEYKRPLKLEKVEEEVVDPTDFDSWEDFEKHEGETYLGFCFKDGPFVSDGCIEDGHTKFYEMVED